MSRKDANPERTAHKSKVSSDPIFSKGLHLVVDYRVCTGCRMCEVACSIKKERTINPDLSRIKIYPFHPEINIPVFCHLCDDPKPCVSACPQTPPALFVNEKSGALKVDREKCLGMDKCGKCAKSCPAKAIRFHPKGKYAIVCDLCDLNPACVGFCSALGFASGVHPGLSFARPPELIADQLRKSLYFHTRKEV
jgi:Fe-S-cluster-containing dehydrogenase component